MFSQTCFIFLLAITSVYARNCAGRDYGHGSIACVCNSTYCDDIAPLTKSDKGVASSYSTTKAGERFNVTQLKFLKAPPPVPAGTVQLSIDPTKKYQKIIGFGGAFTDAAGINIAKLSKDLQTRLIKDYFGSDGIEYSIGRIPIGGCDFSTRPYDYDEHPDDFNLTKFALEKEDFSFKIPYLLQAKEVSPHKIRYYGSPWSSPKWIKENHELNHGGFIIGKPGEKYYKYFARYLVRFIHEYAKQKVDIWGITIENEPGAGYNKNFPWNSLGFNKELERDFVKLDLGPELEAEGFTKDKFKLMIFDDQLPNAKNFANGILSDKDAAKHVSGVAFHWYDNVHANWSDLDWLNEKYPEVFLLATEACEEWHGKPQHVYLGSWDTFNRYATDIMKNMNHFTTGWTDWNLVLDLQGGPNWVGNFVDAPIIVNETAHEYYKQPIFYAMGHFSKFLIPDSVRIHSELHSTAAGNNEDPNLMATVFQRPDGGNVAIILNKNNHPVELLVHDPVEGYLLVQVKANAMESLIWY